MDITPVMFSGEKRTAFLQPPMQPVEFVLDTDAKNEIDDQFAIVYALTSPQLKCKALYAAPFRNSEYSTAAAGMEGSYQEVIDVLHYMHYPNPPPILRGSDAFITDTQAPIESATAHDLIKRCRETEKLFVVAIGALTNIASALLLEPTIAERMIVVWLGGQPDYWFTAREFNLSGDIEATRIVLNSGVPLVRIPCKNVAEHVRSSPAEIDQYVGTCGAIGAYLSKIYRDIIPGRLRTKVIWDIVPLAWLINEKWVPSEVIPTPKLLDNQSWDTSDATRHTYRVATHAHRDLILLNFVECLEAYSSIMLLK